MGANNSIEEIEKNREKPVEGFVATLYYFPGRGLADQIRWLLASLNISFTQKIIKTRQNFLKLVNNNQLIFGQLPLLQINNLELVQSQSIIKYIAKKYNFIGGYTNNNNNINLLLNDEIKCDMISNTIFDLILFIAPLPFHRYNNYIKNNNIENIEENLKLKQSLITKWHKFSNKFELIILNNNNKYLVSDNFTYVDILLVHCMTWYIEECGPEIVDKHPLLVDLQHRVFALPGIQNFIKSDLYYPIGDYNYVKIVNEVLER